MAICGEHSLFLEYIVFFFTFGAWLSQLDLNTNVLCIECFVYRILYTKHCTSGNIRYVRLIHY